MLVNVDGYWDPLIKQLQHARDHHLLYKEIKDIVGVQPDAESALAWVVEEVEKAKADGVDTAVIGAGRLTDEDRSPPERSWISALDTKAAALVMVGAVIGSIVTSYYSARARR